jgi:Asp-tRNA(Asn)/Glu-tRNA(Gln) amidotransferase A subunit family amidase
VIGLEFDGNERGQMADDLAKRLATCEALRQQAFPNELPPALLFNPLPPGFQTERREGKSVWEPDPAFKRPERDEDLAFATVAELAGLIRSRQLTSEELTRLCLDRLQTIGPGRHCAITVTEDLALGQARRADEELREGKWRGPLHGIPYAAKDLFDTRGIATTWGVPLNAGRLPAADATVIRKLQDAGAVLVAKTSLGELAMGDVWFGGRTRNAWDPERGSSGSSAGSAAAGLVPFALGSETLGSIVSPATLCGTTGLRPTFGRVSRAGAMTLCWSLDKVGPLARSAEDCALVLDAIRRADAADPTTVEAAFRFTEKKQLRVGYVKADFFTNMSGHPCVVVPNGDKTGGKAASICFIGQLFGEADAVQLAGLYQNATDFHRQRPPLEVAPPDPGQPGPDPDRTGPGDPQE